MLSKRKMINAPRVQGGMLVEKGENLTLRTAHMDQIRNANKTCF